jgi:HSP20 family molecular chaperone IbpA
MLFRSPLFNAESFFDDVSFRGLLTEAGPKGAEVTATDAGYLCELDMPGVLKEDVEVKLHNRYLSVKGVRKRSRGEQIYKQDFLLPDLATGEGGVEASLECGVLRIKIAKKALPAPVKIDIS